MEYALKSYITLQRRIVPPEEHVPPGLLRSFAENLLIYLFLNSGMVVFIARLVSTIKKGTTTADHFTRVMIPSFLFLGFADLFMILGALFHGRLLFPLLKKDRADDCKFP